MSLHALLLLSDSALPLGSFAFSSGLESHLAHLKHTPASLPPPPTPRTPNKIIPAFLHDSLTNHASTLLPFVLSAYRHPARLKQLDDTLDASTPCTVARRASTAQGRALVGLWTRALRPATATLASAEVESFIASPRAGAAHLAPLWGAVCAALGLGEAETAYVFLLGHAKAVVSAGVRAGVLGPYQGQMLLASEEVKGWVEGIVAGEVARMEELGDDEEDGVGHAGVSVPVMDLWMGRHEMLYSRIFNS
ncbi:urease accessory protein UreF [Myriangium duriaei CBS 260.36]|uniref:Urease accessory protein UreF n=1 Tax=Myriangium duriaei CBS 260.36 TaxID=1168546 RepID=A0A9P4MQ78_9PEZI|nr:urease accessory protein UreF [Myriangium duriaei CBS 260.36]